MAVGAVLVPLALVDVAVRCALAALLVLRPLARVGAAVLVDILAMAVGAVLVPLALVDVAVRCDKLPVPMCSATLEVPLVGRAVWSLQEAMAVALIATPLPGVPRAGLHDALGAFLELLLASSAGLALVEQGDGAHAVQRLIRVAIVPAAVATAEHAS